MGVTKILIIQNENDLQTAFSDSNPNRAQAGDWLCVEYSISLTSNLIIDVPVTFWCRKDCSVLASNEFEIITEKREQIWPEGKQVRFISRDK